MEGGEQRGGGSESQGLHRAVRLQTPTPSKAGSGLAQSFSDFFSNTKETRVKKQQKREHLIGFAMATNGSSIEAPGR